MICWLLGHRKLILDVLNDDPLIGVGDQLGHLVDINMCARCRLIYWEVTQHGSGHKQPTLQGDSVTWN